MNKFHRVIALAAVTALAGGSANAAVVAWNGTGATDTIGWGQLGGSFTPVASGSAVTSTGGINGTVTSSTNNSLVRRDQGNGWNGNFANGATLLWNQGNAGDIKISFATAVAAAGAQFQSDFFGPFTARVTTDDGSFFDIAGSSNSNGDNSAVFVGAMSDAANILSITFHQQTGSGGNDFAIGNLQLIPGGGNAVPEPASWALMIGGFGLAGAAMRRRRSTVRVTYA